MKESCNRKKKIRSLTLWILLILLCPLLLFLNLSIGSVEISPAEVIRELFGKDVGQMSRTVLFLVRLPRALSALILGGALGISGYLLQTFFRNPIAGPFVLGVSGGAKLCVAVLLIVCASRVTVPGGITMVTVAFFGALLSMGFVLLFSRRMRHKSTLIVAGIMIGYICSAVTDFIVTFADDAQIVSLHNWSRGSLSGMNLQDVGVMTIVVGICLVISFFLAKAISAYRLGEDYAISLGVNIRRLRIVLVITASLLAACVTAYAGPVSFVGIAVPQLARALFKTEKPLVLIPASFLGGGIFCLVSDLVARSIFAPAELSISTVTAIFGAPVVIAVLFKKKGGA